MAYVAEFSEITNYVDNATSGGNYHADLSAYAGSGGGYCPQGNYDITELDKGSGSSLDVSDLSLSFSESFEQPITQKDPSSLWNRKFQEYIGDENSYKKFKSLCALASDFTYSAQAYGKIIISERGLQNDRKIIKSKDIGGRAGGEKFVCQGIFFKFALDVAEGNYFIYGGGKEDNEKAMKAANHELNGLMCYFSCEVKDLHYPLMTLIKYRGFVLIAMTSLPIGGDTLHYGSATGGKTVFDASPTLGEKMKICGGYLGLCGHRVVGNDGSSAQIYGPADIEGHQSRIDGKFYVLDFARVMPPEAPGKGANPHQIFYNLLRPQFLQAYKKICKTGLCSDSLSGWIRNEPDKDAMEMEIHKATKYLHETIIPDVARQIDKHFEKQNSLNIPNILHRAGINLRHLGQVRTHCNKESAKRVVLTECVARTLKNLINAAMRHEVETNDKEGINVHASDERLLKVIFSLLQPYLFTKQVPSTFLEKDGCKIVAVKMCPSLKKGTKCTDNTCTKEHLLENKQKFIQTGPLEGKIIQVISDHRIRESSFYMEITLLEGSGGVGLLPHDKKLKMEVKEKDGEQVTEVTSSKGSVTQTRIKMAEHDTVGIYYNSTLKIVNFIKDGHPLGSTIEGVPEDVVPQIGIKENSKIAFNFGSAPFKFDLNAFCRALDVETPSNFIELGNLNRSNWKKTMKKEMVLRYRGALDPKEVHKKYNIMGDVDLSLLVRRLASITGITFSERVEKSVNKDFVLLPTDVVLLTPTLRHMGIIEYAKAVEILYKVQSKDSTDKSAKKTAKTILLLEDSKNMLEAAIAKLPLASPTYQFYLGEVLSELSKASPKSADSYRAQAFASYEEAIRLVNERTEKFETDLTYFHILQDAQLRSADLFLTGLFQDKTKPWHAYLNHSEFGSAQKRYAELGRYGHSERAYQEFNDLALKVDMTNNPLAMTQLYLKSKILFHLINQSDKESIKDAAAETYFKILRKAISFHQKEKTKGQHLFSPTEWNPNTKDHMNEIQQIWSSWAKTPKTKQRILSQIFESSIHGHELAVLIHICQSELKLLITALDKTESMQQKIKFGSEIMNELIKKMISQEPEAVRAIEIKLKHIQQTPLEADFSNMVGFYVDFQTEPPKPFDPLAAQKAKEAEKEKAAREQEEKKEKRAKSKKEKQEKEAERLRQEAEKVAEAKRAAEEREKAAATAHKKEKKAQSERGSRRSIQTVEEKERPEKPAIKQKSQIVALEDGLKNIASPQKPRPGQVKMAEAEVQLNKAPPSKQKEEKEKTIVSFFLHPSNPHRLFIFPVYRFRSNLFRPAIT